MTDYRDYKEVVCVETANGYKRQLRLDCGHSVFRYSKVAPKKVKCEWCEQPASVPPVKGRKPSGNVQLGQDSRSRL